MVRVKLFLSLCLMFPNNHLNQTAVYWAIAGNNGTGGYTWATAIEVSCRWIEGNDLKIGTNGKEFLSTASVQVAQDLVLDSRLYLGTLASLSTAEKANPRLVKRAFPIRVFEKTPRMTVNEYYREVFL